MNVPQILKLARDRGFKLGIASKTELIRAIQRHEGNFDCFGRTNGHYCNQTGCLWHEDCTSMAQKQTAR